MRQKLAEKGFDSSDIDDAVRSLVEHGYLSERRFAEGFLRARMRRGEAPWLAAHKARMRGVDAGALETAAEEALGAFDADAACAEVLARRDPGRQRFADPKRWQREARFLRQKGFDSATILRALKRGNVEDER
jgi:regulatory protein